MANESVTRVTADASGYRSELDSARKSAQAFMLTQDQAAQRVAVAQKAIAEAAQNGSQASAREINSFVSSLTRAADTAGKTRSELLAMKAAQLGIADAAAASIAQLRAVEQASSGAGEAAHEFSLNSSAARRELAVLAHEASQGSWKNFGGSLMVLAERADALSLVMSPLGIGLGVAAGAAVLFARQVLQGAEANDALAKSAQVTNGYLGLTASDLTDMSRNIAGAGLSIKDVQGAMTALVSSGKVAADQLSLATKVTTEFAQDTGVSADKAAESMIRFAQDPQKALEDLQGQYHTFTAAQVDVIENYVKTGDNASAYKVILQGMDAAHERFKESAEQNIGLVRKLWDGLKQSASSAINAIDQIGVAETNSEKLAKAIQLVNDAQKNVNQTAAFPNSIGAQNAQKGLSAAKASLSDLQRQISDQQRAAQKQSDDAAQGDAAVAVSKYLNSTQYATPLEQRNLALKKENADFAAATKDLDKTASDYVAAEKRHADNLAEIEKQYQSRNGSKAAASAVAAAAQNAISAQLAALDQQQKDIETKLKSSLDHIKSLQDQGLITQEDALKQAHDARADALQQELKIEQQEVDIAQGKKQKAAMERYAGEVKSTQDKIVANDQQFTDDSAKLAAKRAADLKVYTDALSQQLATQQAAADQTLAGLSMGSNDRADYDKQIAIQQDYDRKVADLARQRTQNKIGPEQYADELAATQDYYDRSVAIAQKSSADIRAANADWTTGAKRAMADYADDAANVAASTASTFQDAFRGMEDAFANFVTTGKLNFGDLAKSVIADIARMQAKAAISGLFSFATNLVTSYFGSAGSESLGASSSSTPDDLISGYGHATGGYIAGAGTGTSDSIPARLSNGEYVLTAAAVKRIGVGNLDAMNSGAVVHGAARFASGGLVGDAASTISSSRGGDTNVGVTVNASGGASFDQNDATWLQGQVQKLVDSRMAQKMKGQGGYAWQMKYGSVG